MFPQALRPSVCGWMEGGEMNRWRDGERDGQMDGGMEERLAHTGGRGLSAAVPWG